MNLRIQTAHALDDEVGKVQKSLRIFLRDPAPLNSVGAHLATRGDGEVSIVVLKDEGAGEVEIALPERYRIDQRIAAAMRAVPGVVEVELV